MRANSQMILRSIDEENILVPIGEYAEKIRGIVSISDTGAFLWRCLKTNQTIESLVEKMTKEYDIDVDKARTDIEEFIDILTQIGCIDD